MTSELYRMATKDKYVHDKNAVIIILATAALVLMLFMSPRMSLRNMFWIKRMLIGLIVVSGGIWLMSHGSLRRPAKHVLVVVAIFAISFSSVEGYIALTTL